MTLTVVVGASGSGKTTFLEDVHKLHKCCYVRQYHTVRPYIQVRKIPNFEPSRLPYWDLYANKTVEGGAKNASYNPAIKIGGTMAGEFTAGWLAVSFSQAKQAATRAAAAAAMISRFMGLVSICPTSFTKKRAPVVPSVAGD